MTDQTADRRSITMPIWEMRLRVVMGIIVGVWIAQAVPRANADVEPKFTGCLPAKTPVYGNNDDPAPRGFWLTHDDEHNRFLWCKPFAGEGEKQQEGSKP